MATVTKLKRKKGTVYRAQIRIKRDGKLVHSEAKSFSRKALADQWASQRELELQEPGALERARQQDRTVGWVLRKYQAEALEGFGRTKRLHIAQLLGMPIADESVRDLTAARLIQHLRDRRATGITAATANNDLVWLRVVFDYARHAWHVPVDMQAFADAAAAARQQRLIGTSKRRERRVSDAELEQVLSVLRRKRTEIPMEDIVRFAVASARRQEEITRLRWADLQESTRTCLLRDVKSPQGSKGNHKTFKLTPEAMAIIKRQPKGELIFPYKAKTIGAYFTRAVHIAEVEDLRFHDLRHEATSRLFERGYSIIEVQQFTLHESWDTLRRYTHLRPEDVREL